MVRLLESKELSTNVIKKVDAIIGSKYLDSMVAFQQNLALESEELVLNKSKLQAGISKVINNSELGEYYLIFNEKNILQGMLLVISEWSDWRAQSVLWIHSVYIDKAYRKQGLFSKMYNHLKEIVANSHDLAGIRLYVDKTNHIAMNVYKNLGMSDEHYKLYEWLKD